LTIAAARCVAGANIGDGPGFEVVLFCSVLTTFYLLVLCFLIARASGPADSITIECDLGAGIRAGRWFAGTGVVIGACVAGDWISVAATLRDFVRYAWPLAIFAWALDCCRLRKSATRITFVAVPSLGAIRAPEMDRHVYCLPCRETAN
jgi:hypothetical protein